MNLPLRVWVLAAVAGGAAALAGCYRPDLASCAVTCVAGDICPVGLSCAADGYCHAAGDDRMCVDAGLPDADPLVPDAEPGLDAAMPVFDYTSIAAGHRHACAIREGGILRCWGENVSLQLALPAGTRRTGTPTDLPGTGWTDVEGAYHTCGVRDGGLYCWGENNNGQCGQPASSTTPVITGVGSLGGWLQVSTGEEHTCAIRDDGAGRRVSCWGADGNGQLGDSGAISSGNTPREIGATAGGAQFTDWAEVSAGNAHTCARRDSGATYCWGAGGHGEGGTNDLADYPVPTAVVSAVGFTQLSAGVNFTCGIGDDTNLYCWGDNSIGQLGRAQGGNSPAPERVGAETGWTAVSTGFYGACGLRVGQVYCWGAGSFGEIGDGTWSYRYEPTLVPIDDVVEISAGHFFHCARTGAGEVWCWGSNGDGQLGFGDVATKYAPARIGTQSSWQDVAAGLNHTCAVLDPDPLAGPATGELYCWGWNRDAELGVATPAELPSPVRVMPAGAEAGWINVAVGADHTCATRDGGAGLEVWCWGSSSNYQVGNGAQGGGHPPQRVATGTVGFDAVVAAPYATCALIAGDRWCWGEGTSGQLGNGSTSSVMTAAVVSGEPQVWTSLSLGALYGCGTAGGGLYCWGSDGSGQLGLGTGDQSGNSPAVVASAGTWTRVATSFRGSHVCGIVDGGLRCWGSNASGQLGNDTTTATDAPVPIGALTGWTALGLGSTHSCGIESGDLYCWGGNDDGQLGNELLYPYADTPQKLIDTQTWTRLSSGQTHSCAITVTGELWCWGGNIHGAIGDGSQSHGSPVRTIR